MKEYTLSAQNALKHAKKYAKSLHQSYVGTEHILLGLMKEQDGLASRVMYMNGVRLENIEALIKDFVAPDGGTVVAERGGYSPRAAAVLDEAQKQAERFNDEKIGTEHILLAIIKEGENVAVRLLITLGVNVPKIYAEMLVSMGEDGNLYKEDLPLKTAKKNGASMLEQYSRDLTKLAQNGKLDPVIGRDTEIQRMIQILSRRTKNNPCLVGEPGVGKTAIVEGLAQRIVAGDVPDTVKNKRVLTLDLSGMVAGSKYRGEFEERIKKVMKEVIEDGNIFLFLDELHTLIGAGGAEGAIDASNILKPSLSRGEIQLIGATTLSEYRKYIEKDAALERRFQPVTVEEPTEEEAIRILKGIAHKYEEHHKVTITEAAIEAAVRLSARYINDRNLPDKAIDLIDEAASAVKLQSATTSSKVTEIQEEIKKIDTQIEQAIKLEAFAQAGELKRSEDSLIKKLAKVKEQESKKNAKNQYTVGEDEIAVAVAAWTKIPVSKLNEKEADRLLKLESILHKRVVGQNEAVEAISKAMRRGRVGLQDPKRPIGSFLFLGPTGVGKTELSKALAEAMFGSEDSIIRVDMSEYMESHSVSKMIGSPPGYVGHDDGGQLSDKIRQNPYSVVLFDEIEKAHPDVFNILLQVLDDGHITDSKGRKVSFKNTVIIMTSNAGAMRIMEPKNLGFATKSDEKKDYEKMKSAVMEEVKRMFKPEFLNRIDDIMVFHALTGEDMHEIVTLLSKNLSSRCEEQMGIRLNITPAAKKFIVEKYTNLKMGARPLKRAIQTEIEDALAEQILLKNIQPNDKVRVGVKDKKILFTKIS
ncbi:MAG: ATP-dependent Clp protease ATP-binding subunit [Lachnospiraceae bacterium]|nr:ATP-dependent Clp protease ATP-binding subunit [Lachnospiraceae bacterium]